MKQLRGGFSLLELDVVDSTNEYLKRQGGQLPDKTVVMAHRQTAGKGRLGRSWQSEPGESLTVSLAVLFAGAAAAAMAAAGSGDGAASIAGKPAGTASRTVCQMAQRPGWRGRADGSFKSWRHPVRKPQWGALLCGVRHRDKPMSAGIFF